MVFVWWSRTTLRAWPEMQPGYGWAAEALCLKEHVREMARPVPGRVSPLPLGGEGETRANRKPARPLW
jgi:hypothetical protein